jgi:hypothetical protein
MSSEAILRSQLMSASSDVTTKTTTLQSSWSAHQTSKTTLFTLTDSTSLEEVVSTYASDESSVLSAIDALAQSLADRKSTLASLRAFYGI